MTRIGRYPVLAVLGLLLLAFPQAAGAADPPMLGARLDTSGTWVAIVSKATIPTHVELSPEGDIRLDEIAFDMAPGEVRRVPFTGSGLGYVSARMTPLDMPEGSSSGAIELRAWVRYVAPPPPAPPLWPLFLVAALVVVAFGLTVTWRRRHAAHRT